MTAPPCPTCGSIRTTRDVDANHAVYHCPWCGTDAVEVLDPTADGLQREWERR